LSDDPGIPSIVLSDSESLFHAIHKHALAANLVESVDLKRHFLDLVLQIAQAGVEREQILKEIPTPADVAQARASFIAGKTFLAAQRAEHVSRANQQAWASEAVAHWQTQAFEE
jgi:hypothetical protein